MFDFLGFFFKLFFSTFFSILYSYFIIEEEGNNLEVMLFAILATSIASIVKYYPDLGGGFSYSILIFTIIYCAYNFFNIQDRNKRILFIFPGIIGLMIGLTLMIEAIILMGFLYIVKNNLNHISSDSNISDSNLEESEENNK